MAIEFNCPHCAGLLRARDTDAGRAIDCENCSRLVVVPAAPQPAIEFLCPHCGATIRVRGSAIGSRGNCPACRGVVQVPAPADDVLPVPIDPFVVASGDRPSGSQGALLKRRQKFRKVVYLVPIALVVSIASVGLYFLVKPEPPLVGKLKAERVDVQELGPILIDRAYCQVPEDQFAEVLEFLRTNPLRARSQLLRVEFQGLAKGVGVAIHTGDETEFVRVDPAEDARLQKFLARHAEVYDQRRRDTLQAAVPEFLTAIDRRRKEGGEIENLLDYRNRVGLATSVHGFGFVVVARHRGALYPCVHEDRQGRLYFALPRQAREFELAGQQASPSKRDPREFAGKYEVRIGRKVPSKPVEQKETPETPAEMDERASDEDMAS